ncbi:hypothetical protein VIBNISOn1_480056 [Vibrio nigripulchritudo SOn1]|uniref:Coenzyme F390 synthetase n=1 Tax=Vibrio nigripulchritudo SOn1 TaxID=1238450 RepID=A0AAV2VU98_9VIBR|nr:phenylacetate--CoA ligase family protein [Vibrio nigripulchritudo]CCO48257.1 hypothetical protein VIBNISOn1_480056 [Vibrio nigripulchritudo SOn1]
MNKIKSFILRLLPLKVWPYQSEYNDTIKIIKETEFLNKDDIHAWQLAKLKVLINYVWENSKGYREHWKKGGFSPNDLQTLEDIKKIPVITKEIIRNNIELFSIKDSKDIFKVSTGGSTGIPFSFYNSKKHRAIEAGFVDATWSMYYSAVHRKSLRTIIRGGVIENGKLYDPLFGLRLSSRNVTVDMVRDFIKSIDNYKTPILHVYPSSLYVITKIMLDNQIDRPKHLFDVICFGSEPLFSFQLEVINRIFKEPKSILYGSTEKVVYAANCSQSDKYHIFPQYGVTEIIKEDNTNANFGELGEIIGTSFWGLSTPFIRYKTGDMAVVGADKCAACGRDYQTLECIEGRSHEFVLSKNEKLLSMTYIAGCIHDDIFDTIKQFRFKQERPGYIEFLFVRNSNAEPDIEDILVRLQSTFGEEYNITINEVDHIPLTKAGKMTYLDQSINIKKYLAK